MAHILYVDLSAKAEQWTKASAVAASNDHNRVLLITAKAKAQIRQVIRRRYSRKLEQYRLLAALVYLVVKPDLPNVNYVVIDSDYAGQAVESQIKEFLIQLIRRDKPDATAGMIRFQPVKGKPADKLAKQVFDGALPADRTLTVEKLEELFQRK